MGISIDGKLQTEIHYIWQRKKLEPMARKTIFLPKEKGSLNVKELETHNLALGLKHLLSIKHNENQLPWTYFTTYWSVITG